MKMNRRVFLKSGSLAGAGFLWFPKEVSADPTTGYEIPTDPGVTYFSDRQRQVLSAMADLVLPGAGALGAARYLERLLTAFDHNPPPIFADGKGGFVPLNRQQDKAWRLYILGSAACGGGPNDAVLGPIIGLREEIQSLITTAETVFTGKTFPFFSHDADSVWNKLPLKMQQDFTTLVVESVLGDPAYGGNLDRAGWNMIYFDGPSLPEGYSQYNAATDTYIERPDKPLSTPNPGADPAPVDWMTMAFFKLREL
jgi:hypothetical protein